MHHSPAALGIGRCVSHNHLLFAILALQDLAAIQAKGFSLPDLSDSPRGPVARLP
jgi:hypothetical protein